MKINVASWNIWVYGPRDFQGIAKFVRENKIDILGIQEVGIYHDQKPSENIAEEIAEELKFDYVFYEALKQVPEKPWAMGNAILSKFPIVESEYNQLTPVKYDGKVENQPRILIKSKIQIGDKMLNFLTTHLQFTVKFTTTSIRLAQVEKILSVIKKLSGPIILAGDFNVAPESEEIRKIEEVLARVDGKEPTWTIHPFEAFGWKVNSLKYRIDHIFLSKDLNYENFSIIPNKISDHLPIMATIEI
ncbi:MAG TPA: endonuclease/exonuclease/phosphatase family protein [archaeon]|nr:endonuclease/exonuclease/phosphatase family protein [archaeon]